MLRYDVEPMENQQLEKVVLECPNSMVETVFPKMYFTFDITEKDLSDDPIWTGTSTICNISYVVYDMQHINSPPNVNRNKNRLTNLIQL